MNKTKVLVIDDEVSIRETIVIVLKKHGYETFIGSNGVEGLEQARKQLPDLIICDLRMELEPMNVS